MRKFIFKLVVLTALALGLQLAAAPLPRWPDEIAILDFFMKRKAPIVYFGDSTINWAADEDKSQASMPQLLQILLPDTFILKLTHASYEPGIYRSYVEYIAREGYRPAVIIIPVNLRSFSVEWDRQPLWQFEKDKAALSFKDTIWQKFYKPLAIFKFFDPKISRFDYEQTKVYNANKYAGPAWRFDNPRYKTATDENMRNKLIFRYMSELKAEHRKLVALKEAVRLAKKSGIEPVVYLTPVDCQTGTRYLGPQFLARIRTNAQTVIGALAQEGVPVLDLSCSLGTEYFTWTEDGDGPYYPNEHLRLLGRMFVVKNLAEKTALRAVVK